MKKEWLVKTLALGIVVLFVGAGVVSAFNGNQLNKFVVNKSKEFLVSGHIAYAYISYSSNYTNGPCYFDVNNPGTVTKLSEETVTNFLSGGTWTCDEKWYACQHNTGMIYIISTDTGHIELVGGGGTHLNDLAYDPVNNELYGAGETALFLIDMETGSQTMIGPSNVFGIACDKDGTCYGIDSNSLYTIDLSTGNATFVSHLINFNCSGGINAEIDIDNEILYLIGFSTDYMTSLLYTCDTETGVCNLVGQFGGNSELNALAIPYNWSGPTTDFTWTPSLPKPGEAILFNASDSYDPNGYITLYKWDWDHDGIFDENHTSPTATHTYEEEGYYPVTLRVTDNDNFSDIKTKRIRVRNQPPRVPIIYGPSPGKIRVKYEYNFSISDPDGDSMYIRVDWGNGTPESWQGPYDSNTIIRLNHTWNQKGNFIIRAQAKDIYGMESDWGTFEITMPRNRISYSSLFLRFLERFSILRFIF